MRYGLPYKGSKNASAKWVIDCLPSANIFIDLLAGGCAVTHAAMLSGKYKRFIANDINGMPFVFRDAINGEFDGFATVPTREQFFLSDDAVLKLLYSFGNDQSSYLWGEQYEMMKVSAERMLIAPSLHERRMYYRQFIKELIQYWQSIPEESKIDHKQACQQLQGLEWIEGLERIEALQSLQGLQEFEATVADYRNIYLPPDAVVYADPPYRNTGEHYGGFDFDAFDEWLNTVDHPVYVSEYDAPRGCVCIAEKKRHDHMAAYTSGKKIEKIFLQERYIQK